MNTQEASRKTFSSLQALRSRRALREIFFFFSVLLMLTAPAQAATVVLNPTKDTWLNEASPTFNYGAATTLTASHHDNSSNVMKTALLYFDLSVIPSDQRISSATLKLKVTDGTTDTLYIRRMLQNDGWGEGAKNGAAATAGESSYNVRASPTAWVVHSTNLRPAYDPKLHLYVDTNYGNGSTFNEDVTELIRVLHANQTLGNGLMINVISADTFSFASREAAIAADRPQLTVTYEPVENHQAWLFQETSWSGVSGEIKNSYTTRHGTAIGGTANSNATPAKTGSRYGVFDGVNDAIAIAKDASLDFTSSYTVMFWMKAPNQTQNTSLISNGNNFNIYLASGFLTWRHQNTGGTTRVMTGSTKPISNQWTHFAFVHDASNNSYRAYISYDSNKIYVDYHTLKCDGTIASPYDAPCIYSGTPKTNANANMRLGVSDANTTPFLGDLDDVRIYSRALSRGEVLADAFRAPYDEKGSVSLAAFQIVHDGSAQSCTAEDVTIRAIDSGGNVMTGYTGTVTLATSTAHGTWAKKTAAGTLTAGAADSGNASYSFAAADNGVAVLTLANNRAESLSINLSDSGVVEDPAFDPALVFKPGSLRFLANAVTNLPHQIAGKTFSSAPFQLELIDGACSTVYNNASQPVDLALECLDPSTCTSSLSHGGVALASNAAGAVSSYTATNLNFVNGKATLSALIFPDAGQLKLHARSTLNLSGSNVTVSGSSNAFVVRPFAFDIAVPANPAASNASGSIFKKAGENFPATLRAVIWEAADDADNNGAPDAGANLSNNALTPGFGRHASAPITQLNSNLVDPGGGAAGTLNGGGALGLFNKAGALGAKDLSLSWSEVGILGLTATHTNYLGSGLAINGSLPRIGRFYPASFTVNLGSSSACGSSTYAGLPSLTPQPFPQSGSITAKNLGGGTTSNYAGSYAKLTSAGVSLEDFAAAAPSNSVAGAGAPTANFQALSFSGGVSSLTSSATTYRFNAARGPYAVGFEAVATDSDGVTGRSARTALQDFRLGRLRLDSAGGPVDQSLILPLSAEYFDGAQWTTNPQDSCTAWNSSTLSLSNYTDNLNNGETSPSGSGTLSLGRAALPAVLRLSAAGSGNDGSVRVLFDLSQAGNFLPWLRHDWNGDGTLDPGPSATAGFGQYRGSDRVIYWKETQ